MKGTRRIRAERRRFLRQAALGGIGLALARLEQAGAQTFPDGNLHVTVASAEGGGTDRDARTFCNSWSGRLRTNFEFAYYPGAAGQVGYLFYLRRRAPDARSLLFSFTGAEVVMLTLHAPQIRIGRDVVYLQETMSEPMALWVSRQSRFKTAEQLVAEAVERPVTVAVARLPHPSSIGMLALAEATGANFILVPYGGGAPTTMATLTGEVECSALALTTVLRISDQARFLGVFDNRNAVPDHTRNAPTINEAFDLSLPPMTSSKAWAIHGEALRRYPERVELLQRTMRTTMTDADYVAAMEAGGVPRQFIAGGDQATIASSVETTIALANRYRGLLTGM